jgi:hypothetical protein
MYGHKIQNKIFFFHIYNCTHYSTHVRTHVVQLQFIYLYVLLLVLCIQTTPRPVLLY